MLRQLLTASVAFSFLSLASAWHFTPDHKDGIYGVKNGELELLFEMNVTAYHEHEQAARNQARSSWISSDRSSGVSHWKRQALPSGQVQCNGGYVPANDLANCLIQAESWCGVGTVGSGATILNYEAYAWKSNLVFLYICNWNSKGWFSRGSSTCWSAEVAAMIGLVENQCGYGSGGTQVQGGWYLINDWNIGMGFNNLGLDGCPGLDGNHDGQGTNISPAAAASILAATPSASAVFGYY